MGHFCELGNIMTSTTPNTPPESFVKQVRDALEHLYDFPYLQQHPLIQTGETDPQRSGETPGAGSAFKR